MYNWVFFSNSQDYYRYMYQEILRNENVKFYSGIKGFLSPIKRCLYRIPFFKPIILKNTLRRIKFNNKNPICFVYYSNYFSVIKDGIVEIARQQFPNSKHVHFLTDAKVIPGFLNILKSKMDCVGVFDPVIAKNFNLEFWPNSLPTIHYEKSTELYDLCFIGNASDKAERIEEIVRLCKNQGIRVAILLKDNSENNKIEGVHYLDKEIPYIENLDIVKNSRCILELKCKRKFDSCSLRVQEAVILNKKILTDNKNVFEMPYCKDNPQYVQYYEDVSEIDWKFLKEKDQEIDWQYDGKYSANSLLNNIQFSLEKVTKNKSDKTLS